MTQEGPLDGGVEWVSEDGSRLFMFRQTGTPQFHLGERKAGNERSSILALTSLPLLFSVVTGWHNVVSELKIRQLPFLFCPLTSFH